MKKGLGIVLAIGIISALGLNSCGKEEFNTRKCNTASLVECGFDTTMVNVKVWNKTGYPLCNVRLKFQTNTPDTFRYGSLDTNEVTCYTKLEDMKVFPRVRFNLGSGSFRIPDSLVNDSFPYNSLLTKTKGFYTIYIFMGGELDSLYTIPSLAIDSL